MAHNPINQLVACVPKCVFYHKKLKVEFECADNRIICEASGDGERLECVSESVKYRRRETCMSSRD
jgi:hypothetical protein